MNKKTAMADVKSSNSEDVLARKTQSFDVIIGQIGLCCAYYRNPNQSARECPKGSIYYPLSISLIYNRVINLLQRHVNACSFIPEDTKAQYSRLREDHAKHDNSKAY
mmetsp:Transcript_43621/g.52866  ORF Transcript_43621/g.52866 Transcript_43621/m.52866 type:complete len:107 (-) Transcript_43621:780-1100(-)